MKLSIIKSEKQYDEYLDWVDMMFDNNTDPNSEAGEQLQMVLLLIKQYEDIHYKIPIPDPIEVIKLKMEETGLKNKDLVALNFGSKGHVSSLLSKRKSLTLELAKKFHKEFGIPAEVLLS